MSFLELLELFDTDKLDINELFESLNLLCEFLEQPNISPTCLFSFNCRPLLPLMLLTLDLKCYIIWLLLSNSGFASDKFNASS